MKMTVTIAAAVMALAAGISAQNRFDGYNVIVDAVRTHTKATCAVRYVPPATTITITDLNPSTPMKVTSCGGSGASLTQKTATTAQVRAADTDYEWCFQGEDKAYRITFQGDQYSGPVTYIVAARSDERSRGFFNIRDFGAVGDGQTDDTIAFKSAMAAMATNNGGTLTIPDGDYVVSSPVTVPSGVIIQGTNGLHSMASTSDLTRKNPARITLKGTKTSLFRVGECTENVSFRDIELYSLSNDDTNGLEAYGSWISSQGFNFDRVTFQNFNRGINAYGLPQTNLSWQFDYIKINACRFIFNRDTGIYVNSRNTDWKIMGSLFVNPRKQPGQNANAMHFERVGMVLIQDTFSGGFSNALGGTFINILDSGTTTIIGSQAEAMTASIVYNGVENPNAGDYSYPITIVNSIFEDPIIFKARRTLVSTGSLYGAKTWSADDRLRVYSTGDRFCYDGYILGCRGLGKANFDRATIVFMTGQPSEGQVKGHPTFFGTDVQFGSGVQFPAMPVNTLPAGKPNGTMVYCSDCRRNTTPCQPGGNGAPAMMAGNQWSCL